MRFPIVVLLFVLPFTCFAEGATRVQTPYAEQKVVYDFYFDEPEKNQFSALLDSFIDESIRR